MSEYSVVVKTVIYRQYEVVAKDQSEAQTMALKQANKDMPHDASNSVDEVSKR